MPVSWRRAPEATTTSASWSRMPWSATIAGSTPPLTSRRSRRSAMLRTIWTWTHEWSDMARRSELSWAMCHQPRTSGSAFIPSRSASSLRLPRVGALTWARSIASSGCMPRSPGPAGSPAAVGRSRSRHGSPPCGQSGTGLGCARGRASWRSSRLDDVAVVTLQRPDKRNALSIDLRVELADAFTQPQRGRRRSAAWSSPARARRSARAWTRASSAATSRTAGGWSRPRRARSRRSATASAPWWPRSTGRRSPAALRCRSCATCGSPTRRRSSAIPSCRAASRPATRRRGRCCPRPSPRSSA